MMFVFIFSLFFKDLVNEPLMERGKAKKWLGLKKNSSTFYELLKYEYFSIFYPTTTLTNVPQL